MKKTLTKYIFFAAVGIFLAGAILAMVSLIMGGNFLRATNNIEKYINDDSIMSFDFSTPEPHGMYDDFFGTDIYDIFEQFGLDEDDFMPYESDEGIGNSGKLY